MNESAISICGVSEGIVLIVISIVILVLHCRFLVMVGWRIVSSNRFEMRVLWKVHLLGNGTMTFGERSWLELLMQKGRLLLWNHSQL